MLNGSPNEVEVFTLSSGVWRNPLGNLPSKRIGFVHPDHQVVIDGSGFIYWLVYTYSVHDGSYAVISFDLTSEEFREINFPVAVGHMNYRIYKLRDSVAFLTNSYLMDEGEVYKVWIIDNVSRSFRKLLTINLPDTGFRKVVGFWKNDQIIMETRDDDDEVALVGYEPCSKRVNDFAIYGERQSFFVSSYTESLLLLNH